MSNRQVFVGDTYMELRALASRYGYLPGAYSPEVLLVNLSDSPHVVLDRVMFDRSDQFYPRGAEAALRQLDPSRFCHRPHGRPRTTLRGNDTARHVHIRLSPDEYATLIARAQEARRTLADFIRAMALR